MGRIIPRLTSAKANCCRFAPRTGPALVTSKSELFRARSLLRGSHLDVLSAFRPCGRNMVEFFNSTGWAFSVKLIGDEGKRCAAYRWPFARRFPKRALSRRRRAVRERVTHRLAPVATLHFRLTKRRS